MGIKSYTYRMNIDSFYRLFFSVFLLLAIFVPVGTVRAEEQSIPVSASSPMQPPAGSEDAKQSLPMEEEVTILRDDYAGKYNLSTLVNLSKAYWRLGAFDTEDNIAVGNFLKINDCQIYTEYINDDMEWQKIMDAMKHHLDTNREKFPVNFQFLIELRLGRYDPALGGFPIGEKTQFKEAKRILVSSVEVAKPICFDPKPLAEYPRNVIILTDNPFTLDFLKLDEHVAQAYILRKKSEFSTLNEAARVKQYERDAYLRLRVTFTQYNGNLRGEGGENLAIVFGNIDGYEVFEDRLQKRLMLSVDLKKQREQEAEASEAEQMSVPVETAAPVIGEPATSVAPKIPEAGPASALISP